jgi:hypothetical protein
VHSTCAKACIGKTNSHACIQTAPKRAKSAAKPGKRKAKRRDDDDDDDDDDDEDDDDFVPDDD